MSDQINAVPKKKFNIWKWVGITLLVLFVIGFLGSLGGNKDADTTKKVADTQSSKQEETKPAEPTKVQEITKQEEPKIPVEYKSALSKAETYASTMNMSKKGVYNQLTSTFDKFTPEAAQYAIDNVKVDWKANALKKAKQYQSTMSMSPAAVRTQLVSTFDAFTAEEADYAIQNLDK